ncbi:FAD-binding oxidoreductase [bacterium]|nr:FAD-binding oxidoreductase [bacterium]MBU1065590.1 FAD-binding oxidoreductase [bacterium]MBU1632892.1 FAD-binding oxidoreductase [bacterium]MBU1873252.1 FAD-binding oxidoreductase [bacterium]
MTNYDVIIIGAGSIGVPLSFYLSQKGLSVLVLETLQSAGRGQNRAAIGGIRATHSDPAKIIICRRTIDIVSRIEEEYGYDVHWISGGYLFPVYTEKDEVNLKNLLEFQKQYELNINWIGIDEIEELVPGINTEKLRGGTYSPEDGSASPLKLIDAFYMLAQQQGVDFHFNEAVTGFETAGSRIASVNTDQEKYSAGLIVDAAGAHSRELGAFLNLDIPVYPDSHEAGITEPVQRFFEPMIVDIRPEAGSANYYFYQNAEGQVVFCITPDPKIPGTDCDNTSVFLPQVVKRMVHLYPRLRNLRVRRTWRGLYPMTPDGFPIVGFAKEYINLLLTTGMCGQGFMIGPGLGEILSEIIVDNNTEYKDILKQLSLYRSFSGEEILN